MQRGWGPHLPLRSVGAGTPNTWQDRAQEHYQAKTLGKKTQFHLSDLLRNCIVLFKQWGTWGRLFLLLQCLLRTSEWHQLRGNLAGRNLLILCHLHPISQQCQLSALELFKFSSSPSVSAAQDCRSFSCRRKPVQPLALQSFPHQRMSLSHCCDLSGALLPPVHLPLPGSLGSYTGFPLYLMNLHASWVSLPPRTSLCPHTVRNC